MNVAIGEKNLGNAYYSRAARAQAANDLDRCMANLKLVLPHFREAARIFTINNHVDSADETLLNFSTSLKSNRKCDTSRMPEQQ